MIKRIVKMVFRKENIEDFIRFTGEIRHIIRNSEGCLHLDILQDKKNPEIFFTYSCWRSEDDLENYRNSDFFKNIWPKTKKWFAEKPSAWSLENVHKDGRINSLAEKTTAFERILKIMNEIREKCPWDASQTNETLRTLTIEETYELAEAVIKNEPEDIKKELGDLFLHIIFYAEIAEEENRFDIADVINALADKLVYRHPHVFGDTDVSDKNEVAENWEELKLKEKQKNGNNTVLGGIPEALPAMIKAVRIQDKARGVGFDWEEKEQVWDKVKEELSEFETEMKSGNTKKIEQEFGDVLFSLINAARLYGIDPENALERTNLKFIKRFNYLENKTIKNGISLKNMSLDEMEKIWQESKKTEI